MAFKLLEGIISVSTSVLSSRGYDSHTLSLLYGFLPLATGEPVLQSLVGDWTCNMQKGVYQPIDTFRQRCCLREG